MKIYTLAFLLLLCNNMLFAQNTPDPAFNGCGTDNLMNNNPELLETQERLDDDIYRSLISGAVYNSLAVQTYTIPVVVHIIHNNGSENISDAQVQNAIAHFNAKYARGNADQIQFCLAQRDPNGNATTGITRNVSTLTTETMEYDDVPLKSINRWPSTCYLNIWVIKEILSASAGNGVVGYAYFPSAYGTNIDGLVIEANYFGSSSANDAVGTHEIGHYFGLYHTFQGGCKNNNCLADGDRVCDTPPDKTTFASCNPPSNSCSTDADDPSANNPFTSDVNDNSKDYMDYSFISCYDNFTPNQYTRMLYYLNNVRYPMMACNSCASPCPSPVTAAITVPTPPVNVTTGSSVSFAGTGVNASSFQWYLTAGNILGTGTSFNYAFSSIGAYYLKFKAVSTNSNVCGDAVDSILINIIAPVVASCKGSINLNPLNSALRLPLTNENYSSNGFTWECWFKLDSSLATNTETRGLINQTDEEFWEDITLAFGWYDVPTHDHLIFRVDGPGGLAGKNPVMNEYVPPGGFLTGTWYHAAGVMDYANHISKLFLNGQPVSSLTNNAVPITRVAITEVGCDALTKKQQYPGPPLGGEVDEVRIWNKPRNNTEILANYNTCLLGNEDYLLSYYRCNQSAGSVAIDASVNHQNATLYNGASWSAEQPGYIGINCYNACIEICGNGIDDDGNGLIDEDCACPAFSASKDTALCQDASATLTASGATSYQWSPATGLNTTTGATVIATPTVTTTYTVTTAYDLSNTGSSFNELVFNGDFSLGNTGFVTDYQYSTTAGYGRYFVGVNYFSSTYNANYPDHSPTSDNMHLSLDGSNNTSLSMWEQTINTIGKNQFYKFSFWTTRTSVNYPHFQVHFVGDVTGDEIVGDEIGKQWTNNFPTPWDEVSAITWNSRGNNIVTIRIKNLQPQGFGNDFSLDDISLKLATNICRDTATVKVVVNPASPPAVNLGNDISLCTSGTRTLHAGAGFEEYKWQDGSTDSIFTAFGPGKYWVTVKKYCSSDYLSDTVSITVTPSPTLDLGNDITLCINDGTTLSYTSNGIYTSFQWTPNTAITCPTCPNPFVNPQATTKYYLAATTADGCTNSDSVLVTINSCSALPQSGFLTVDSAICASTCINFINASINATSWLWAFPGAMPATSTDQNPHSVCYVADGAYDVTLIAYNAAGSDTLTLNKYVKVKATPPAPVLSVRHDTIFCTPDPSYTIYQWYRDSVLLTGKTDSILIITQGGDYAVKIKNADSCQVGTALNVGIKEFSASNNVVSLSFNPATGELNLYGRWKSGSSMVSVYNVLGAILIQQALKPSEQTVFDLTGLAAGVYFVHVRADEAQYVQKIIVP